MLRNRDEHPDALPDRVNLFQIRNDLLEKVKKLETKAKLETDPACRMLLQNTALDLRSANFHIRQYLIQTK